MRPKYEVADVFRQYGDAYRANYPLSPKQRRVMYAIEKCRTAALGGHVAACQDCGVLQVSYNSCGDRNCPKCKALARLEWVEKRREELLPIPYYHLIFTLDHSFIPLIRCNRKRLYTLFFSSVAAVLKAAGQKYLGGEIGILMVLHTWGQTLSEHPHIHCLVTGGALLTTGEWQTARDDFLFPALELSASFREAFCRGVEKLWQRNHLQFAGQSATLVDSAAFDKLLAVSRGKKWHVYIQPPSAEPEITLKYISRYINRVAISNYRLLEVCAGIVRFAYRDYQAGGQKKVMCLPAEEFIRRYLLHIFPHRFIRIRYFGLWHANCRQKLNQIRQQLGPSAPVHRLLTKDIILLLVAALRAKAARRCPDCGGQMVSQYELVPQPLGRRVVSSPIPRISAAFC